MHPTKSFSHHFTWIFLRWSCLICNRPRRFWGSFAVCCSDKLLWLLSLDRSPLRNEPPNLLFLRLRDTKEELSFFSSFIWAIARNPWIDIATIFWTTTIPTNRIFHFVFSIRQFSSLDFIFQFFYMGNHWESLNRYSNNFLDIHYSNKLDTSFCVVNIF